MKYFFKNKIKSSNFDRYIYPDFLPNPVYYFRDKIKEKLERHDMINRRKQIFIPEFYVGKFGNISAIDFLFFKMQ